MAGILVPAISLAQSTAVNVYPSTASPRIGQTFQFTDSVRGLDPPTVTWFVNGIAGGNSTFGTISSDGLYTTPGIAVPGPITVLAQSTVDPTVFGTATVSLQNPLLIITSVTPGVINTGYSTNSVSGQGFAPGVTATLGSTSLTVQYNSSTSLQVSGTTAAQPGDVLTLTLTNPDPGSTSDTRTYTVQPLISLTLSPTSSTIQAGDTVNFRVSVNNTLNRNVNWLVNGIVGGNSTVGTIAGTDTTQATYTSPAVPPAGSSVTIQAQSQQNTAIFSPPATVTITNPPASITSISPTVLYFGSGTITVQGANFLPGAQVTVGNTPFQTTYVSSTTLTATGPVSPVVGELAAVTVTNSGASASNSVAVSLQTPNPQMSYGSAFHFLEQATWGPRPKDIQNLQTIGFNAWFQQQYNAPLTAYDPTETALTQTQNDFFNAALTGQDQLRQRVAFALAQIVCVSALKEALPAQLVPYLQLLEKDAFGNYYQLLTDVTLSPTMGEYLNMADNYAPSNGSQPNQNYAREFMQLFAIGSYLLNEDGSAQLDSSGNQIPTYDDTTVQNFARIFTGWTFAPEPGADNLPINPPYFGAPMVAYEPYHDEDSKTLLNGLVTQPGQTAEEDLQTAIQNVFNHQNVAPFVALRLIQHLVESNPTPAYISRVASVFENDGTGTRGNLWAVVKAILTDQEARNSDQPSTWMPNGGHLREPVLYVNALLRELDTSITGTLQLGVNTSSMGQQLFSPPSVFSYYPPTYPLPGFTSMFGPEFDLLNSATALAAINWINMVVGGYGETGFNIDFTPFTQLGSNPQALVLAMSNALLAGQMPQPMQSAILTALSATTKPSDAVQTSFYLTAAAPFYMVQH